MIHSGGFLYLLIPQVHLNGDCQFSFIVQMFVRQLKYLRPGPASLHPPMQAGIIKSKHGCAPWPLLVKLWRQRMLSGYNLLAELMDVYWNCTQKRKWKEAAETWIKWCIFSHNCEIELDFDFESLINWGLAGGPICRAQQKLRFSACLMWLNSLECAHDYAKSQLFEP